MKQQWIAADGYCGTRACQTNSQRNGWLRQPVGPSQMDALHDSTAKMFRQIRAPPAAGTRHACTVQRACHWLGKRCPVWHSSLDHSHSQSWSGHGHAQSPAAAWAIVWAFQGEPFATGKLCCTCVAGLTVIAAGTACRLLCP